MNLPAIAMHRKFLFIKEGCYGTTTCHMSKQKVYRSATALYTPLPAGKLGSSTLQLSLHWGTRCTPEPSTNAHTKDNNKQKASTYTQFSPWILRPSFFSSYTVSVSNQSERVSTARFSLAETSRITDINVTHTAEVRRMLKAAILHRTGTD